MPFLSRLASACQTLSPACAASAGPIQDPALQGWLQSLPVGQRHALTALAADLQHAIAHSARMLDLSAHAPHHVAQVPPGCLQSLRRSLDHLMLPPRCEPSTVARWLQRLDLRELTAHGVTPAGSFRDRQLPRRLVALHCDFPLIHRADRQRTERVVDACPPPAASGRAPTLTPGVKTEAAVPPQGSFGTVDQWRDAEQLVDRTVSAAPGDRTLSSDEASQLLRLFQAAPTALLPLRGRVATRLCCAWLADGGRSDLTPEQAQQLKTAMSQSLMAFLIPSDTGPRMADRIDLQWLSQKRSWEEAGSTASERGTREADFDRDLHFRHQQLSTLAAEQAPLRVVRRCASAPTPAVRTLPAPSAAVAQQAQGPRTARHDLEDPAHPYDDVPALAGQAPGTAVSEHHQPSPVSRTTEEVHPYDNGPPLASQAQIDDDEPRERVRPGAVDRSMLPATLAPAADVVSPDMPAWAVPADELAKAQLQLRPYMDWLQASQSLPHLRMKVSPAQLTSLGQLTRRFSDAVRHDRARANALWAGDSVVSRVAAGRTDSLSRGDVSLLAQALSVLEIGRAHV